MVDQIRAWLDLIPPEERKRWEWLESPTTWLGMPRSFNTPVGQVYNPLAAVPDAFGAFGTAVRDPIQQNVMEPAVGEYLATMRDLGLQPRGGSAFFPNDPGGPTDTAEQRREYLHRSMEGSPVGQFAVGMVTDPTSYVGGGIGRIGRAASLLPGLGRAGTAVAAADDAYTAATGAAMAGVGRQAVGLAKRLPGVGRLLEDSPQKAIAQFGANLGRAVRDPLAADRLEHAVTGSKLGLTGRAADWEKKIEPGWQAIDNGIGEVEHPVMQAVLLRARAKGLEQENLLEARFEQHRIALAELRDAGDLSAREFGRETQDLWQQQARATRAIQFGLIDTINAVKSQADELVGKLPGTVDAAGTAIPATLQDVFGTVGEHDALLGTARTALQRAGDEARAAHDFGTAIKGGTSGVDKVTGVFAGEGQRIAALQAQDPIYRQARETAMQELNTAAQTIYDRYKDVTDPEEMSGLIDTARSAYQAAENELAPFTQGIGETLQGLAPEKLSAIVDVWGTGSAVSLDKQVKKVLTARRAIREQAEPLLQAWYREHGHDLATRSSLVENALSNADRLLKEPALLDPAAAAARTEIVKRLNRFGGAGDVLKEGDLGKVAANLTTNAYATSLGVSNPAPWMGAAITTLGAWKELALLSPRYQLTNFITQLTLSEAAGVPASRVISLLRRTLPEMKGAIMRGERIKPVFDEATSTSYGAIRGTADGYFSIPDEVIGRQGEALLDGASGPATTRLGQIPLAIRAGVPGLATGGAYWAQNPDDPDRARNALLVGGSAAAFGAATPKFAFYNQQLTQATETAARGAAYLDGFEKAIGSVSGGTGLAARFDGEISQILKPISATSVGKELTRSDMLPGLNTVSGMQTLSDFLPAQKGVLPPLEAPPVPPRPPVPGGLPPMTPDEFATVGYQRIEEPGRGRPDVSRPQGIFTTPASATSPHADLGGEQFYWRRAPDLNVLSVSAAEDEAYRALRGSTWAGSGVVALKDMLGPQEFARVTRMSRQELLERIEQEFPGAMDPARGASRDRQDIIEAWAGLEARKRGYDAIEMIDPTDPAETEFVALTERALVPAGPPLGAAEAVVPPLLSVTPPDSLAPRVLGLNRAGPSPVVTVGREVDVEAVQAAYRATDGKISPDVLEQVALKNGATAEQAARLRSRWDQHAYAAENNGIRLSNDINFDYSNVNRLTAGLRESGAAPFVTWQTFALPKYASLLLQNPRFIVAIDGLNNLSDSDVEEGGLTSRFARLVGMGVLGDVLAEQVLGQAGTVRGNPLSALFPYADLGRETTLPDDANPVQRGLAALQPLGLGPGPLVTLPLMAAGATSELPVDLFRTSTYLRGLSTQLTGREADPELMTKRLMGAARQATGAGAEPTVTGDFLRDRAIRQRIAEIAVQETGKPPAGPYLLAMDDPASQIWLRARAQIDRQRMGEAGLGAVLPFRSKFLSDTEAEVRRIREQTGVGPTDAAARQAQPATAAELAQAELETRKKPLKPGETLEKRAATNRYYAAEAAAAGVNPLARTLNSLGGNQALARQYPEWQAFLRRTKHMPPKRRGQLTAEFLGQRPALREYVATHNIYG